MKTLLNICLFKTGPPEEEPFKEQREEVGGEQLRVDEVLEGLLPESRCSTESRSNAANLGGIFILAAMTSVSDSNDSLVTYRFSSSVRAILSNSAGGYKSLPT